MKEYSEETRQEVISKTENPDSIELGSAGSRVKVYVDFSNKADAEEKIKNALELVQKYGEKK